MNLCLVLASAVHICQITYSDIFKWVWLIPTTTCLLTHFPLLFTLLWILVLFAQFSYCIKRGQLLCGSGPWLLQHKRLLEDIAWLLMEYMLTSEHVGSLLTHRYVHSYSTPPKWNAPFHSDTRRGSPFASATHETLCLGKEACFLCNRSRAVTADGLAGRVVMSVHCLDIPCICNTPSPSSTLKDTCKHTHSHTPCQLVQVNMRGSVLLAC